MSTREAVGDDDTRAGSGAGSDFPPIGDYAVVGDCGSVALISRQGSVEWLCWPRFDSPSLFAAILDRERGGYFRVAPSAWRRIARRYVDDTAVLETRFETETGTLCLRDCMVAAPGLAEVGALWPEHQLLREMCCTEGEVEVAISCDPRFGYGRTRARLEARGSLGIFFQHGGHALLLRSEVPLAVHARRVEGRARLRAGDRRFALLAYDEGEPATIPPLGDYAAHNLELTLSYWRQWSGRCGYEGPYRDAVLRSAITLKLMTYAASGAVVAAPTTSLPEKIGGVRNWDYRYCWLRDACFTLRALFELGYVEEGSAFFSWLLHATHHSHADLNVLYDVFGGSPGPERELDHLRGYRDSRPARVGNAAEKQLQLDLYGELIASAYEFVRRGGGLSDWSGRLLTRVGRRVCAIWKQPDQGIWEIRSARRHHVHSLAMCWLALDRLLELARAGHLRVPEETFTRTRDEIRAAIEQRGWCQSRRSYTSVFDGEEVDASLLLLALYGYVAPDAPRMRATYERIHRELGLDGLLRRYAAATADGLPSGEGAFGICSFWAVEYLARIGRVEEAERQFEQLVRCANDVGLFAEEIEPASGEALGNFPQAFTHVGLISAALAIAEMRGTRPESGLERKRPLAQRTARPGERLAEDLHAQEAR
jgi:GH15 family glucan-1,4-alpha-glucosidase